MVSAACKAGVSSSPIAAAMPPCAYPVLLSKGVDFVRTSTQHAAASPIAARRQATPLPMMRKSMDCTEEASYFGVQIQISNLFQNVQISDCAELNGRVTPETLVAGRTGTTKQL